MNITRKPKRYSRETMSKKTFTLNRLVVNPLNYKRLQTLTLNEKAQLAQQLTADVVTSMKAETFASQSETNRRLSGLMRTLGDQYVRHAQSLAKQVSRADEPSE